MPYVRSRRMTLPHPASYTIKIPSHEGDIDSLLWPPRRHLLHRTPFAPAARSLSIPPSTLTQLSPPPYRSGHSLPIESPRQTRLRSSLMR